MDTLEKKLGYAFRDPALIQTALTHSSYANEHRCQSNERLEYVGDSVLGMVVATHLYALYPEMPEGGMTRLRAELVCEHSLWTVADKLGFGRYLRLGKGEELSGGRERHSILADCVEAVIAALYLDGGMEPARRFIDEHILSQLDSGAPIGVTDYKTELQELVQQRPGRTLSYELVGESGPDHRKTFAFRVSLDGERIGEGEGHTKKEAEQNAARCALEGLKSQ
ncbi:MAG: ribonuclease III [Oscillospiraceae bacterium]